MFVDYIQEIHDLGRLFYSNIIYNQDKFKKYFAQ